MAIRSPLGDRAIPLYIVEGESDNLVAAVGMAMGSVGRRTHWMDPSKEAVYMLPW